MIAITVKLDIFYPGWKPERQQFPDTLHCTIMPQHVAVCDKLLDDLKEAAHIVKVCNFIIGPVEKYSFISFTGFCLVCIF